MVQVWESQPEGVRLGELALPLAGAELESWPLWHGLGVEEQVSPLEGCHKQERWLFCLLGKAGPVGRDETELLDCAV